jgi:hypothetical protein
MQNLKAQAKPERRVRFLEGKRFAGEVVESKTGGAKAVHFCDDSKFEGAKLPELEVLPEALLAVKDQAMAFMEMEVDGEENWKCVKDRETRLSTPYFSGLDQNDLEIHCFTGACWLFRLW